MGDAQSAQREGKKDAAAEEESGKVDEAQTEQNIEDKPLKNNGQISEINGKADGSIAEVNGHCEDENATEAILSPDEDVSETEEPLQEEEEEEEEEETQLENVEINEREPPTEADANEMTEMDAKQNDINEGFRRFFSNIGLKLTVKRGSSEIATDVPDKTNKEEPNRPEDVEDTAKETKSDNAEQNADVNIAQETYDNDSTTCPTLTDVTSEDVLENAEEKTTETKDQVKSDHAEETTAPAGEDAQQDAAPEEEPHSTFPSSPEEEVVVSPIKRFFTTGIFSGLRKKKKPAEDETTEKELVDMGKKEVMETTEQTAQEQQQNKDKINTGVEAAAVEVEEGKSSSMDPSTITVPEPEILSSQEKDKVQASPLKRLLSGSSLKKLSKKQRSRKSSDAKLSDSGEHVSDQLLSSTESAENQKEEGPIQPSVDAAGEEDGAWASFKKLVTPKKHVKRSSLSNDETQIPGSVEEPKPSEGEQISDHSTEEGKKRKDSSVSWEAVLCGSGRRRSRKTSDSDDEMPQVDHKQESGSKHGAESPLESSNENEHEIIAASKQAGSPSEGDGGSTWKSLKRLVTPKRKAKDENESKENIQSDNEVTQDESFSIKKLLPGRKKRKSAEKQDQISSDEADKDVASGDEDSETPAVVPLSEFDTVETEVHIQTQADIESHIPEEANHELQQNLLDHMAEPVLPCDSMQTEAKEVQDNDDAFEKQPSTIPATNEEPDDLSESISKHQLLSDIPEEGILTETMATPASVAEEVARDDTIAEDLIEITSEAITAPEPASDITMADETEMISAVSQLSSESSKTSGNTTPVPVEYDIMETDTLLHQAVETISISPKALPVCSDDLNSERIVGSVSHPILETFVTEEATILEIHRRFDATAFKTGLSVEELEAINELSATPQTESISEVNDSVSTEVVSEVLTEEFNTAEISVDEVHDVNLTHPEESIKELERFDESHHLVECPSEVNVVVSGNLLPEGEQTVPDVGSLVDAHQAETETPAMEQEVQIVAEKEIMYNITDEIQIEDKDQPPVGGEELQESVAVQAATSDSEESNVQSLQKEPEKVNELETDAAKTEHVQMPSASKSVQTSTLDSEESSVLSPEEEVKSEDIPQAETKVSEVSVEQENKELPLTAVVTEHVQEPEALEAVKASTLDSEESSVQSFEKEVISEDIPEAESVTDEPKQTGDHLTEVSVEPENKELLLNAVKNEHVQEPELLEATTIDSEEGSAQSLEKEAISVTDECKSETILPTEVNLEPVDTSKTVQEPEELQAATLDLVTDKPKQENEVMVEPEEVIPQEDAKTELVQEPEVLQTATLDSVTDEPKQENEVMVEPEEVIPPEDAKTEFVQEPEVLQTAILDSVTDEPKQENEVMVKPEEIIPPEDAKTELVQEPEVLQTATLDSVTDEPKQENEVMVEPEEIIPPEDAKTELVQEPEVLQTATLDSVTDEAKQENEVMVEPEEVIPPEDAKTELVQEPEVLQTATLDSVTDEPKQENEVMVEPEEVIPPEDAKTELVQEPEVLQTATLDSVTDEAKQENEVMVEPEEVIPPEDAKTELVQEPEVLQTATLDSVTDEPKQESEVMVKPEEVIPPEDAKTELVQEPEVLQTATLDSVTDEPKQENEVMVKPEEVIPPEDAKTELVQEPEVLQTATLDSVTDEPKQENEVMVEPEEVIQAVQTATIDSEGDSLVSLEMEVTSEDLPAVGRVIDEPKEETLVRVEPEEKLPVEAAKTEHVQEEVLMHMDVVTESIEGGTAQELERQILLEDTATPDVNNVIASVTDEIESEIVTQLGQTLEITEDQKTESIPQVEQEDSIPEVVDELQTLTAVHVSSVNEEAGDVQVLGKTAFLEKNSAPCADNAAVADEPKQEVLLSAVEVSVEGEKETELPDTETKTAAVEHAVLAQVVICNLKDVSVAIPDVLIEKTSEITEPLIETMASELEFKKEVEAATPLVKDDVTETAEEGSVVMMMHVPLVTFEDNHRIQVQVVDVNIKSAETIVDSVLEVGVTEAKEVIDVCHETVEKVDNISATPEIEKEIINEENKVAIQEVIQHVKKNLPETISEPVVVNWPDAVTKLSEMVESESNEVEDQKVMDDSIATFSERQDEAPAVISDDFATGQQVSEDLMQTPDILGSLDVSIDDHKEDLKETKAELKSSEVGVTAEEVKSVELDAKQIHEQAQITQIAQSQIVTPSNTGLVVPQNTGIISSIGNVESPSSLSLEFKLNIQFGQAKAPASPPPLTERIAPVKQTDVSEVGVQVVEAVEPEKAINPTQRAESQKQPELTEVAVQATEITEPAANSDSTERAMITNQTVLLDVGIQAIETVEPVEQVKSTETVTSSVQATEMTEPATNTNSTERVVITNQPVLLDVGIHAMETVEPVEQIKSTETVTSSVHATKTIQPVRPKEKREVFLSQPVVSCQASQETKAEEPGKQTEENDQDVWMDAEEVIYTQEETELSFLEVDEPPEPQTESEKEEKAGLGHEVEMAPNFKTEEEESQQEMHKTGTCEVESEGEDFAVALEHLEIATASATTMELD